MGRPWRPYAKTLFMNCEMGSHITPAGWDNGRNPKNEETAEYSECKNYGPGASTKGRVTWSHQLSKKEASKITMPRFRRRMLVIPYTLLIIKFKAQCSKFKVLNQSV